MLKKIEGLSNLFLNRTKNKKVRIISHHDTDGITSAAILATALSRLDIPFSIKIIKQLEEDTLKEINENEVTILLDLGSNHLNHFKDKENIFLIDHHELPDNSQENINMVNPHTFKEENINASSLTYLFCKNLSEENKDLAHLAIIGMVGDRIDQNIGRVLNTVLNDAEVIIKKGLLLYPATRPINKVLEFSSVFIPGVTGSSRGAIRLLRETGIERTNGSYKSLIELEDEEMSKLITSIILRLKKQEEIIGNIYLLKFYNKLEDVRQLSAIINACSRLGESGTALALCLGNEKARKRANEIYTSYKQHIVDALNYVSNLKKIEGKNYTIINARDKIKDTIIGTIASILSSSYIYDEGTIIIAMAYSEDKIKVSARITGKGDRNLREIITSVTDEIGGESGGHQSAAGCIIPKAKEQEFLETIKRKLEVELVKI